MLTSFFVQLWQADIAFMIHKIVSIVIFLIIDEIPKQSGPASSLYFKLDHLDYFGIL